MDKDSETTQPAAKSSVVAVEALPAAPSVVGKELASPGRRLTAILIDAVAVGLLGLLGRWFVLILIGAAFVWLARRLASENRSGVVGRALFRSIGFGCFGVGLVLGAITWTGNWKDSLLGGMSRTESATGIVPGTLAPSAYRSFADARGQRNLMLEEQLKPALIADLAGEEMRELERLREEVENLRRPSAVRTTLGLAQDIGLQFTWAAVYFTLLPFLIDGRTVGKVLCGIRVVRLDGKRLRLADAFRRYGGYAAGLATGLFGFLQIFWVKNRQGIQDRIAGTVVIRD